jgi:homopolymeric O-antigen transport system permease protein
MQGTRDVTRRAVSGDDERGPADGTADEGSEVVTFIRPTGDRLFGGLGELWTCRELLMVLVLRDVSARFKQTILGPGWVILQPLLTMLILTVVFAVFARVRSPGVPYPVFVLAGLLPWNYFAQSVSRCGGSLVSSAHLLTKVYFPRLILPATAVISPVVESAVILALLLGLMGVFGISPTWRLAVMPLLILLAMTVSMAAGLWLAALNVRFRDVGHALPYLIQVWMYATPVAYPIGLVPPRLRPFYDLNPMVPVVEGCRWALLGVGDIRGRSAMVGVAVTLALLAGGLAFFRRTEDTMADLI